MADPSVPFLARWRSAVLAARPRPTARVGVPAIRLVGLTLSTHMDAAGGSCFPGLPLLASETGLERATVSRAVNELVAAGLLFSKRTGRSNRYHAILPGAERRVESYEQLETVARETNEGCVKWTGPANGTGYGVVYVPGASPDRRQRLAHRVVLEITGHWIPPKHNVHHRCMTRLCVNPAHLEILHERDHPAADKLARKAVEKRPQPVDGTVDFHVETGSDATSDLASDHVGSGVMPPEDVQGGRTPSPVVQEHLLLAGGKVLQPVQDVASLISDSLEAVG